MENKQTPSKRKLISIQEEKLIREVNYDALAETPCHPPKKLLLDFSEDVSNVVNSVACGTNQLKIRAQSEIICEKTSTSTACVESSTAISKCSNTENSCLVSTINPKQRTAKTCYLYPLPQITMTLPKVEKMNENNKTSPKKVDIGTLIVTEKSSPEKPSPHSIFHINKRIDQLERKIIKQEMVFRALDPNLLYSSSDEEEYKDKNMKASSSSKRAGCSYIEYSHITETSAFQRCSQQPVPLSASKATTIKKEHNSEQYGRDFTLYDGITARGRRQCASVPCKRNDGSKMAADRVHKIRHKLNPVRDYRLMDTVHYLAQGEFAPRDDGIKLTPSREAVLSDIIYEDVCRTHWPNTRLARRVPHQDRCGTRSDLQHLIDSLLRERVAHVERRKRRHYRIVKLNHRHENSCRPVGKTGGIIVASNKNKPGNEKYAASDHNNRKVTTADNRRTDNFFSRNHKSFERLVFPQSRTDRRFRQDDCSPGPSYVAPRSTAARAPTCCYHTSYPRKPIKSSKTKPTKQERSTQDLTSGRSYTAGKTCDKNPRLVVKKNSSRKKYNKEEPNLEHYILLPTLVVKTSSNMKRQKKFSELYHRILNVQLNRANPSLKEKPEDELTDFNGNKRNIGLNINVTHINSEEVLNK
ncbi:jg1651 [Pararge aegeria aegeria]|uniref:Jg1651 protein n=1 Tax=Pararge aegeria aegeria TaxID=348720 RepID=A0A8S4REF3_9NEOP|nr:jg1651 [Pararge aegeria aegeria]